jgi:ABC-type glycerol-3-phosphate transport system substrate-binding protein
VAEAKLTRLAEGEEGEETVRKQGRITRRGFLKMGGGAFAGAYALSLAGCGGGGGSEGSSVESIELYHLQGFWQDFLTEMGTSASKDIGVGFKPREFSDPTPYQQVIRSSMQTNEAPGLCYWWSGYRLESLASRGGFQDLTSIWEEQVKQGNLPQGLAESFSYDGKQYAVPYNSSLYAVYYNKRIFEEHGLTPPRSWDDLISTAGELKRAGVTPFFATVDDRWPSLIWFEELLARTDPDFYERLVRGEGSYTDPIVVSAMEEWKSMLDAGYFTNLDLSLDEVAAQFSEGKFAMMPYGTWYNAAVVGEEMSPEEEYGLFVMPNVNPDLDENVIFAEPGGLAIPANAPDVDASRRVLEWWVSPEAAAAWAGKINDVPVNPKSRIENPALDELVSTVQEGNHRLVLRPLLWNGSDQKLGEAT